jgi:hypothetical protein
MLKILILQRICGSKIIVALDLSGKLTWCEKNGRREF